jgi:serine/threonine-protein kinase
VRVRLDRYGSVTRWVAVKSWLLLVGGGILLLTGLFSIFIAILMAATTTNLKEDRAMFFLFFFTGLAPATPGAIMIWRGVAARVLLGRFRELAALARQTPQFSTADVQRALDLGPRDAEKIVLDAFAHELLWDDGATPPQAAPALGPMYRAPALLPPQGTPSPSHAAGPHAALEKPEQWVGQLLRGTYRIEAIVGRGGMGLVYAARHERTGRRYAVKTLLPGSPIGPDALRRFEREAAAASALGHPNIVAVHDFDRTPGGTFFMVMDYVDGETLEQRIARVGSVPWSEAKRIALDLASALAAAHAHGLLHRDVKPANVILARGTPERAMLVDFGLVKPVEEAATSRVTRTGAAVGTPMYMSPEQARGEEIDVRSDVYALAATVFELVTGAPPFFDRTLAGVYAKLLTTRAPRASTVGGGGVPPELDAVLDRALAKHPGDRYATMAEFARALEAVEDHAPRTLRMSESA